MELLNSLMDPQVLYGVFFIIALVMLFTQITQISLKEKVSKTSKTLLIKRLKNDEAQNRENQQLERIGKGKKGIVKKYRDLIQNVIISLKLEGVSIENFTTIFLFLGIMFWVGFATFFNSVFIGFLVAVPGVFAMIALVLSFTKTSVRANDNRVMESLDAICPLIDHSIMAAISQAMPSFDPKVKIHYKYFLQDIRSRDMSMREAITELNRKLGPRFDEFARKALMFDEAGEEGMSDIFQDIVEMNGFTRSINAKADVVYADINLNTLASAGIVLAFLAYTYSNPMTGDIMRYHIVGKLASAISISIIIMMYAISQITQMSIDYDKIKSDK